MSDLSDQLNELLNKIHPAATAAHDQLHSLDTALQAEDEFVMRHIDDILGRAQVRRAAVFGRLTEVARMIGVFPAQPVQQIRQRPQTPQPVAAPIKHPRAMGGVG